MNKPKILIVDDDPDYRLAMKIRLRANHYDTLQAEDAHSAIAVAEKEQPNLIILDLGLPAVDGFGLMKRLQDSKPLSSIPVIVVTARDARFNEQNTLLAGAAAYFQKPPENRDLLEAIRITLQSPRPGKVLPS